MDNRDQGEDRVGASAAGAAALACSLAATLDQSVPFTYAAPYPPWNVE